MRTLQLLLSPPTHEAPPLEHCGPGDVRDLASCLVRLGLADVPPCAPPPPSPSELQPQGTELDGGPAADVTAPPAAVTHDIPGQVN